MHARLMQIKPACIIIFSSSRSAIFSRGYCNPFTLIYSKSSKRLYLSQQADQHEQQSMNSHIERPAGPMSDEDYISKLRQRKQSLRKEVRKSIKATYPPHENDKLLTQSNLVFSRLFNLPRYQSAKSIGFFLSMPNGEIQTRDAIRKIVNDGKILYVPRVGLDFEKCDMDLIRADTTFTSIDSKKGQMFYDAWPKNKWNIPEPPGDASCIAQPGDIDLLLVPGLAFDSNGHRLGQGKGYYDRFISKMRRGAKPYLVGVCLEEQYLNEDGFEGIPVTDHDFIMDMVITPSTTMTVSLTS
jgi:5-formyltetrahydrofolate cyclo-ligase